MKKSKFLKIYNFIVFTISLIFWSSGSVFAADDPLTVVDNLTNFIFSFVRAIGVIFTGFGVMQVGISIRSHDATQRTDGFLSVGGGIIMVFIQPILDIILK